MYNGRMATTQRRREGGRRANELKSERLLVRLDPAEKEAFEAAAKHTGMPLSVWVRVRLRWAATKELQDAGQEVPFQRPV